MVVDGEKTYQDESYDDYNKDYFEWLGFEVHKAETLKMVKKFLIGLSLLMAQVCWAADTYNPATNQLSIPSVDVSGTTYTDVLITVGNVLSVGGGDPKGSIDSYNAALNQLTIPSVTVTGKTYTNVVVTVGQVLSVGSQVVSSLVFPLDDLKIASYFLTSIKPFTVSGNIGGDAIASGAGTNNDSVISTGVFDLLPALQRKTIVTGSYTTVRRVSGSLNSCNTSWMDDSYKPLGNTCGANDIVVTSSFPISNAASIGYSAEWYRANIVPVGLRVVNISLLEDNLPNNSKNTAIFKITTEDSASLGAAPYLILETYIRVSTTGDYIKLKETISRPSSSVYIVKTFI